MSNLNGRVKRLEVLEKRNSVATGAESNAKDLLKARIDQMVARLPKRERQMSTEEIEKVKAMFEATVRKAMKRACPGKTQFS